MYGRIANLWVWLVLAGSGMLQGAISGERIEVMEPKTYEMSRDTILKSAPNGQIVDIWFEGRRFTAYEKMGKWIKISGYFPGGRWQKSREELWVNSEHLEELYRPKPQKRRPSNIERYIIVDKSDFELRVIEKHQNSTSKKVIFRAPVAVGLDRCLPKEEGGNCYFTEPGDYKVRWKVHDPKGIEWCIPKFMEKEKRYADDLKQNKRCFRGSIGNYALNIGKSYAIHGTSNPASIGKNASHGCVRTLNQDIEKIYELMEEGDPVYIIR